MIKIGKYNTLRIDRTSDFGLFLEDTDGEDVLLPKKYVTPDMEIGEMLRVFVYNDSEDRIVATTLEPYVTADEFAYLEVKEVTNIGAFMDIGLEKDLLVPFRNQQSRMTPGKSYLVYVYLDETTERLVGTEKIYRYLSLEPTDINPGDDVSLLIGDKTDLGYFTVVDEKYHGLLYENELYRDIKPGDRKLGFVKNIRPDGKIDVTLEKPGYEKVEPNAQLILNHLRANKGFLPLSDKSDPAEISALFPMSKKTFKRAVGHLYKQRMIEIRDEGISLVKGSV